MPIVEIYARRPRSRVLVADIPGPLSTALGCSPGDVWVYVVDVDLTGTGDDADCGARVLIRGAPRDDVSPALQAVAQAVAAAQGDAVDRVWVGWVDILPGRSLGPA